MTERQASNKIINLTIRFEEQSLDELRKLASEKGLGVTTLVRMWVLERHHKEKIQVEA